MRHLGLFIFTAIFISACGGGSSDSGQSSSGLFEDALAILNKNKSAGQFHATVRTDSGNGHYVGCSDVSSMSRAKLESFVESETDYSLCGHQSNESRNPLCIYPGSDAYRSVESSSDTAHPDAREEIISIPFTQGQINVTLTYENMDFEYEFEARNNAAGCDPDTLAMTTTYDESDIDGTYSATIVKIDSNGVPVTGSKGSISCASGNCTGIVTITEMEYDSHTESWSGKMSFEGMEYDLIATLSPDKSVALFVGVPQSSETAPQEFSKSCLFIGAYK